MNQTRKLLIEIIVHRYKSAGLDEVSCKGFKDFVGGKYIPENADEVVASVKAETALDKGKLTIEQYLEKMTDFQLISIYDSQACLQYR